jgi:hypothetical protein
MKHIDFEDITTPCVCAYYQYFSETKYISYIEVIPLNPPKFKLTDISPFLVCRKGNDFKVLQQQPDDLLNIELPLDKDSCTSYQLFELTDEEVGIHVVMEHV